MTDTWESLFKECAVENNHTENYLKECFEYAGSLHQRNLIRRLSLLGIDQISIDLSSGDILMR